MKTENDDCWWGQCAFTYEELNGALVVCDIQDDDWTIQGKGKLRVKKGINRALKIDIEMAVECTNQGGAIEIIHIPPHAFTLFERTNNPKEFDLQSKHLR